MKAKLLGFIACIALLGVSQAGATTYTYNVDFSESVFAAGSRTKQTLDITGTIVTDCGNGCVFKNSDFISWSLQYAGAFTDSFSGTTVDSDSGFPIPLSASSGVLYAISESVGLISFTDGPVRLQIDGGAGPSGFFFEDTINGPIASFSSPFPIAELAATPLPAAFPLFAIGLGAMGLFGWRKKRKNAAAISAQAHT
jgi:hypothetical protein